MRNVHSFRSLVVLTLSALLGPAVTQGALTVTLYDNFDDGNYNGWTVTNPPNIPDQNFIGPDIVTSPQGYALRGVGSGSGADPGLNVFLAKPFVANKIGPMKIEMRALSGAQAPNSTSLCLYSGTVGWYDFALRGDALQPVQFGVIIPPAEQYFTYPVNAGVWHDFAWSRSADGWWSLSVDGGEIAHNFYQDTQLTSFTQVGLGLLRDQTQVEWVRVSATAAATPGSGGASAGLAIEPNVLNLKSEGMWITCHIELGETLDVGAIDVNTVLLNGQVPAELHPAAVGDGDEDGIPDLMVKFDRAAVQEIMEVGDEVILTVTGRLTNGISFEDSAMIRVIDPGQKSEEGDEEADTEEEPSHGHRRHK